MSVSINVSVSVCLNKIFDVHMIPWPKWIICERVSACVCVHVLSGNFTIVVYEIVGVRLELKVFSFNYINKL